MNLMPRKTGKGRELQAHALIEGRQAPCENIRQGAAPIAGRISQASFSHDKIWRISVGTTPRTREESSFKAQKRKN